MPPTLNPGTKPVLCMIAGLKPSTPNWPCVENVTISIVEVVFQMLSAPAPVGVTENESPPLVVESVARRMGTLKSEGVTTVLSPMVPPMLGTGLGTWLTAKSLREQP